MALTRQQPAGASGTGTTVPVPSRRPTPSAVRSRLRSTYWRRVAVPLGMTLVVVGLWELLARANVVLPEQVPPFSGVVRWLFEHGYEYRYRLAMWQTLQHWFAGLLIGGAAGVVLGVALGSLPFLQRLLSVPLEFLRPIPAIVYLPLLILISGSRPQTVIVLAAMGAFWPLLFQAIYGVRAIDPQAMETGRVFGLSRRQRGWSIMLPSVLPFLATGARIASSLALVVAISTELIGGVPGLGTELTAAAQNLNYTANYGLLAVSGIFGLLLNVVLERLEKRLLRWHVSHRPVTS